MPVDISPMADNVFDIPSHLDKRAQRWVRKGFRRTSRWLARHDSKLGPQIHNTLATGGEHDWTPQGLGWDPETRLLAQSYYSHDLGTSLALIELDSGEKVAEVILAGWKGKAGPGHAGGVGVDGDDVYVVKGGKANGWLFTYSLAEIRAAKTGASIAPKAAPAKIAAGSYARLRGNRLYVGGFYDQSLHVYERPEGKDWDLTEPIASTTTPKQVQGIVVRENEYVFSTSFGRHARSRMIVTEKSDDEQVGKVLRTVSFPNMAEAIVEVDGELIATYESGSAAYSKPSKWFLPFMWAGTHLTRTPMSVLGLH